MYYVCQNKELNQNVIKRCDYFCFFKARNPPTFQRQKNIERQDKQLRSVEIELQDNGFCTTKKIVKSILQ